LESPNDAIHAIHRRASAREICSPNLFARSFFGTCSDKGGSLRVRGSREATRLRILAQAAPPRPPVFGRTGEANRPNVSLAREKRPFWRARFTTAPSCPVTRLRRRKSIHGKELRNTRTHISRNRLVKHARFGNGSRMKKARSGAGNRPGPRAVKKWMLPYSARVATPGEVFLRFTERHACQLRMRCAVLRTRVGPAARQLAGTWGNWLARGLTLPRQFGGRLNGRITGSIHARAGDGIFPPRDSLAQRGCTERATSDICVANLNEIRKTPEAEAQKNFRPLPAPARC